ncbi:MAG: SdpI family protein [Gammaproteobacteria bacterium]|nr:SdpI family protein [Gammaproteobacteria bacterium]
MNPRLSHAICLGLISTLLAFATWIYPQLPDLVPSHWNSQGQVDGYMAKPWGVFLLPALTVGIYLMFLVLPLISPHGFRMEKFGNVVRLFQTVMVLFMSLVAVTALLAARGDDVPVSNITLGGTGMLLLVLGNYMGKVRKNFFIGIRTPWTLASDEVWTRTHRLGGWMFSAGGLLLMLGSFSALDTRLILTVVVIVALVPVAYSFLLYRRLEGLGPDRDDT